jgi:excisionase family DNA binding protein
MKTKIGGDAEKLWNVEDVAEYLSMPVQSVCEIVSERYIPHLSIRKHLRFRRSDIDRWLDLFVVPCHSEAVRPVSLSVENSAVSVQHGNRPSAVPLPVLPTTPQGAAPTPARGEKVQIIRGYKVRVRYKQTDPVDQERRRRAVAEILAKSLLRMKKVGAGPDEGCS